jgi:hypothetical protein
MLTLPEATLPETLLAAAYCYYHLDDNFISDEWHDHCVKKFKATKDQYSDSPYIKLLDYGNNTSLSHLKKSDYPEDIVLLAHQYVAFYKQSKGSAK